MKKLILILLTLAATITTSAKKMTNTELLPAQAIKMYEALYGAGVEAELILNDRAPHGNLGSEAAASIKTFISRILLK